MVGVNEDIGDHVNDVKDVKLYLEVAKVPQNDLMTVVNVDLEYMMQYDGGTWADKRTDYLNGEGYSVSSLQNMR